MLKHLRGTALFCASVGLFGCYHATVNTGLTPSAEVYEKSFASGWIYGLVPPSTVETAAKCATGVARIETQLSFVNQLVNFLTLGIYTPMSIKVTCAARSSADASGLSPDFRVTVAAGSASLREALTRAAEASLNAQAPIYVTVQP